MRPGGRGGLLKTGNPGNKGGTGRPPSTAKQRREQFLSDLMQMESAKPDEYATVADHVLGVIRESLAANDTQIARWLIEMQHGSPRSTVINEIEDAEFVEQVMAVAGEFMTEEQFEGFTKRLTAIYEDSKGGKA